MEMDETAEECAIRELEEETGLRLDAIVQVGTYSKVDRDPRGRTITIAYLAIVDEPLSVIAQDDAAKAEWFSINNLPTLAFDHKEIMADAISMYNTILLLSSGPDTPSHHSEGAGLPSLSCPLRWMLRWHRAGNNRPE